MTKTNTLKLNSLEKILTAAGLVLVCLGVVAGVFNLIENIRFVHVQTDALFALYYLRHAIVVGGGFGIGYLLFKSSKGQTALSSAGMNGVAYGLIGYMLYILLDQLRVLLNNLIDGLGYPWGSIAFSGLPVLAMIVTAVVCLSLRGKQVATKWLLVSLLIATQLLTISHMATALFNPEVSFNLTNGLATTLSIVMSPFITAIVAFLLLKKITPVLSRAFYAAIIGLLPAIAAEVAWDFRTDPTLEATERFALVVGVLALFSIVSLLYLSRRAIKQ